MGVKCCVFKLLLFLTLSTWCGAKSVGVDDAAGVHTPADVKEQIQDDVTNILHTGIYSHLHLDTTQVQVTTPVKVTRDGELVSRRADHQHDHGHARARRDLHLRDHAMDHIVHYNVTIDGRELRLDLRPSVTFITPGMVVERHTATGRTREHPSERATSCHYTGSIRGQPKSSIAISACDGLAGLLRTEHGEFWIEPSNQIPHDVSEGRSHVIFKRSAVGNTPLHNRETREKNYYQAIRNQKNPNDLVLQAHFKRRAHNNKELRDRQRQQNSGDLARHYNRTTYARRMERLEARHPASIQNLSRPLSNSKSYELSKSVEKNGKHHKRKLTREQRRLNKLRRRKRQKKCGTKQPPYLWRDPNDPNPKPRHRQHKNKNRRLHRHRLSHHPEFEAPRRSTRSVSKPQHVEVLLVADKSMADFHGRDILDTYLLTIMNTVSSLYMDPTIGNYIKVVVVKIILIEDRGASLKVSTEADATLAAFCKWQNELNPEDDRNPHHHDVAILVTRKDICSNFEPPCSTLGVAHVAGMCIPDRSCSVNEDNGILLAHTITHELGHNFGLYHDTQEIGCQAREGKTLHIMTPIFDSDTDLVAWSRCSKRDVTKFLDTGLGDCLGDTPSQEEYRYPTMPHGALFDASTQCRHQFGIETSSCSDNMCLQLWCYVNGTCSSLMRPAAPGTPCGDNMWCQNRKCVAREPVPQPVDGGWGEWSPWNECSRTCGAGVSIQYRECNNPEPINNGKYCIGERSRYKICNTDPCPFGEPSFREVQCQKYQNGSSNDWTSFFDQDKPCELTCGYQNIGYAMEVGASVIDGTPCRQTVGSKDMCIFGVCHKVGCDWVVDSDIVEDSCGVCGGNDTACETVQGMYNKETTKQSGFSEVAVIPAGSRNVNIEEKVNNNNFISIGSAKTKKFYIYGTRNKTLTEYFVAGSQAIYQRDRDWEKLRIPGPIQEDLKVYQHINRGRNRNPVVTYKYTVDNKGHKYKVTDWSACSVTCGYGYVERTIICVDENDRQVEKSKCYHMEQPRTTIMRKQCSKPACPVTYWWVSSWGKCSRKCNRPGDPSIKERGVHCIHEYMRTYRVVSETACEAAKKPAARELCPDIPPC